MHLPRADDGQWNDPASPPADRGTRGRLLSAAEAVRAYLAQRTWRPDDVRREAPVPIFELGEALTRAQALMVLRQLLERHHRAQLAAECAAALPGSVNDRPAEEPLDSLRGAVPAAATSPPAGGHLVPPSVPATPPHDNEEPRVQDTRPNTPAAAAIAGRGDAPAAPSPIDRSSEGNAVNGLAEPDETPGALGGAAAGALLRREPPVVERQPSRASIPRPGSPKWPDIGPYTVIDLCGFEEGESTFIARDGRDGSTVLLVSYYAGSSMAPRAAEVLGSWAERMRPASGHCVAPVDDYGVADNALYFTTRLQGYTTLEELLQRGVQMSFADVVRILTDVAAGLDHLQRTGAGHERLKPVSVLVSADRGSATLVGGGLLHAFRGNAQMESAFRPAPGYSPPASRRQSNAETDADQYALAVIAYEMITGRRRRTLDVELGAYILEPVTIPLTFQLAAGAPLSANAALHRVFTAAGYRAFTSCTEFVRALGAAEPVTEDSSNESLQARILVAFVLALLTITAVLLIS